MKPIQTLLGILDLLSFLTISFHWLIPKDAYFYVFCYLFFKGLFFVIASNDFASYLDMICASYLVALYFGYSFSIITTLCSVYLAQKALLTLLFARF
jgi:hypothetical protein